MKTFKTPLHFVLALTLLVAAAACGDVGNAPQAETAAAVEVAEGAGRTLPIDTAQSSVKWRGAKVTGAHDGGFHTLDGVLTVQGEAVTGAQVRIDTRSIYSDTEKLTGHLMSADFFDVEKHPEAIFAADQFVPADSAGATHLVTGNLTMLGNTRSVTFPATITREGERVRAQADFIIDRTQWGIVYKGKADDLISNDVRIILDVTAAPGAELTAAAPSDTLQ